jgi:hypothetical protein
MTAIAVGRRQIPPMPDDFLHMCQFTTGADLQVHYRMPHSTIDFWLSKQTPDARSQRRSFLNSLNSQAQAGRNIAAQELWKFRSAVVEAAKASKPRSIEKIIVAENKRRLEAAAKRIDPLAGLTGFDRQLAAAELYGIRDNIPIGQPEHSFSLIGSSSALCADFGGGMTREPRRG